MNNKIKIKSVKSINPFKSVILTIYDIITKGHGGTIECESVGGRGNGVYYYIIYLK